MKKKLNFTLKLNSDSVELLSAKMAKKVLGGDGDAGTTIRFTIPRETMACDRGSTTQPPDSRVCPK